MTRVMLLSDLHLSPTHGFFWENWRMARDAVRAARPELVIVTGDLAINGPDSDEELRFAAEALRALDAPTLLLPGNHDVGDEPPGQDPAQWIDPARLARWQGLVGPDRFSQPLAGWRLIGLNAQICGSGLPEEAEQDAWLEAELAAAGAAPVTLFLHKPLFLHDPAENAPTAASINPEPRARLLERLARADVRLVVSGHLHQHRDLTRDGRRYLWAPATAFAGSPGALGGDPATGLMQFTVSAEGWETAVLRPEGMASHDLAAIKGHGRYAFLRDMPPCPPPAT